MAVARCPTLVRVCRQSYKGDGKETVATNDHQNEEAYGVRDLVPKAAATVHKSSTQSKNADTPRIPSCMVIKNRLCRLFCVYNDMIIMKKKFTRSD